MKIKPCPKCGCCEYLATAHVTQTYPAAKLDAYVFEDYC